MPLAALVLVLSMPMLSLADSTMFFVHNDHLGTPTVMTDANQDVVWRSEQKPFGESTPAGIVTEDARFPGQMFDEETELHYNYYRDYDPSTGRYIQSDPIGLQGGLNTYGYVGGNPVNLIDPLGLAYSPRGEHGRSRADVGLASGPRCLSSGEIRFLANAYAGAVAGSPGGWIGAALGFAAGGALSFMPTATSSQEAVQSVIVESALDPGSVNSNIASAAGSLLVSAVTPPGDETGRESAVGAIVGGSIAQGPGYVAGSLTPWTRDAIARVLEKQNEAACQCQP